MIEGKSTEGKSKIEGKSFEGKSSSSSSIEGNSGQDSRVKSVESFG